MPRMSKLDEFTLGVKARLQAARTNTRLSWFEEIIVVGCHNIKTETGQIDMVIEAVNFILAKRAMGR